MGHSCQILSARLASGSALLHLFNKFPFTYEENLLLRSYSQVLGRQTLQLLGIEYIA